MSKANEISSDKLLDAEFPMQDGPAIPMKVAQEIYEKYFALYGTEQSLKRIGERGGFGWAEVQHIWNECRRKDI